MTKTQRAKTKCHCMNLRRAANAVSQFYDKCLEPIGLSVNQFSLLRNIERLESCSVSDLARYVGLERTTLVRTLKPLMERGLITDESAKGQRNRMLQISGAGQEVLERGAVLWESAQTQIEEKIGTENVRELERILALLEE